ncbi:MAG: FadR family transcriptional regulator [Rhizobiaceae bacterium]|nr:FadR family transcriptional regulator [Rhizobiaceae bacterium]
MTDGLFRKIDHGSTADEAVRQIEFLLLDGVLSSGDRLPSERELADQLSISRPVLRDALKELESRGLVESRHGGGTFVADLIGQVFSKPVAELVARYERSTRDYLEYRRELEGFAAAMAAARATADDRERLSAIGDALRSAFERDDFQAEIDGDIELHNAVGEAAHNIILIHTLRACYKLLAEGIFYHKRMILDLPGSREAILTQHLDIIAAILSGDAPAARQASERHIDYVAGAVKAARRASERKFVSGLRKIQRETATLKSRVRSRESKG